MSIHPNHLCVNPAISTQPNIRDNAHCEAYYVPSTKWGGGGGRKSGRELKKRNQAAEPRRIFTQVQF